jgi:GntR family transcriptional regulator
MVYYHTQYSSEDMLPFPVRFAKGQPVYEQLVYSVKKAILSRRLNPGDPFPSVRQLSAELGINPNTVQKAIAALQVEGLLSVIAGVGTVVAAALPGTKSQREQVLKDEVERLVVDAKRLSITLEELQQAIAQHWRRLEKP